MTLGDRIKRERERQGWSQNELARRARVRQAQLSEVESGKRHDMMATILRRIARTLGVSMDYLAGMYDETESEQVPTAAASIGV